MIDTEDRFSSKFSAKQSGKTSYSLSHVNSGFGRIQRFASQIENGLFSVFSSLAKNDKTKKKWIFLSILIHLLQSLALSFDVRLNKLGNGSIASSLFDYLLGPVSFASSTRAAFSYTLFCVIFYTMCILVVSASVFMLWLAWMLASNRALPFEEQSAPISMLRMFFPPLFTLPFRSLL